MKIERPYRIHVAVSEGERDRMTWLAKRKGVSISEEFRMLLINAEMTELCATDYCADGRFCLWPAERRNQYQLKNDERRS